MIENVNHDFGAGLYHPIIQHGASNILFHPAFRCFGMGAIFHYSGSGYLEEELVCSALGGLGAFTYFIRLNMATS